MTACLWPFWQQKLFIIITSCDSDRVEGTAQWGVPPRVGNSLPSWSWIFSVEYVSWEAWRSRLASCKLPLICLQRYSSTSCIWNYGYQFLPIHKIIFLPQIDRLWREPLLRISQSLRTFRRLTISRLECVWYLRTVPCPPHTAEVSLGACIAEESLWRITIMASHLSWGNCPVLKDRDTARTVGGQTVSGQWFQT